jgi:hypothetical protein
MDVLALSTYDFIEVFAVVIILCNTVFCVAIEVFNVLAADAEAAVLELVDNNDDVTSLVVKIL